MIEFKIDSKNLSISVDLSHATTEEVLSSINAIIQLADNNPPTSAPPTSTAHTRIENLKQALDGKTTEQATRVLRTFKRQRQRTNFLKMVELAKNGANAHQLKTGLKVSNISSVYALIRHMGDRLVNAGLRRELLFTVTGSPRKFTPTPVALVLAKLINEEKG